MKDRVRFLLFVSGILGLHAAALHAEKVIGYADLRPSFSADEKKFYGDNLVEAGYQFSPRTAITYQQQFLNNYRREGWSPDIFDGLVRAKFNQIWSPREYKVYLSYEPRVYLPLDETKRNKGFVSMIRNYFKLQSQLSNELSIHYIEVPIVHLYNRSGSANEANPFYENRFFIGPELTLAGGKLSFFLPVILGNTRYYDYQAGAKNNASWSHRLWIYPEVTYAILPQVSVGVGYESGNLILPDFSGGDFANGFAKGVTQLILQFSL